MNASDKLEMQLNVQEANDGSAIVELPDSVEPIDQTPPEPDISVHNGFVNNSEDDDIDPSDPDREAIRAARREERKLKRQLGKEEKRHNYHLISSLKKQNQELAERLASLEKRTSGAEMARVDKAIEDADVRLRWTQMKLKEAVESGDGDGVVNAQEAMYEAKRQVEALQNLKHQASRQIETSGIKPPDPDMQRLASDWMSKNRWYDPKGRDTDSKVALQIDKAMAEEGYDPSTEEYWDELDERLSKYLPHRYNQGKSNSRPRPRSVVTGSERSSSSTSGSSNEFLLSPQRVAAIKEAGMWDNKEQRMKMIKRFMDFDREQQRGGNGR